MHDMSSDTKKIWLVAIGYWVVMAVLCILCYPVTISDTIARYAPMADHFARGEWSLAFHPRFGVLFQVLAGSLVKLTGCGGDVATQIVSLGFLSLSAVPLWFVVSELFDRRIAWWAVALMLVSDDLSRYALDGLRDTGKCLGFALLGLGVVRKSPVWYSLGLFVLMTLVSYGFAVASVLLFGWCVYWCVAKSEKPSVATFLVPVAAWLVGTAAVVFQTHAFTGHWLPSPHYIKVLGGVL